MSMSDHLFDNVFNNTSEYSNSSSSSASTSSDDTSDSADTGFECAKLQGEKFRLPKGLIDDATVFDEFFSPVLLDSISAETKAQLLSSFSLPDFQENNEEEREVTLDLLFGRDISRFSYEVLSVFQQNLESGKYRPDIYRINKSLLKAQRREQRYLECERISQVARDALISRERLLAAVDNATSDEIPRIKRAQNLLSQTVSPNVALRAKKRYFQEISSISSECGYNGPLSEDENYPEGPPAQLTRKQRRRLSGMQGTIVNPESEPKIYSTCMSKINDVDYLVGPGAITPFTEEVFRALIERHRKRRYAEMSNPELNIDNIALRDIMLRTGLTPGQRKSLQTVKGSVKREVAPTKTITTQSTSLNSQFQKQLSRSKSLLMIGRDEFEEEDPFKRNSSFSSKKQSLNQNPVAFDSFSAENSLSNHDLATDFGLGKNDTLSDLDDIDMMNIPIELNDGDINLFDTHDKTSEVLEKTHASFFSLLRELFCSTPDHRLTIDELRRQMNLWLSTPIAPLNEWFSRSNNWLGLLTSAIQFLCGEFFDQPEDFVPYLEYKSNLEIYQWIGAGRDNDNHLIPLCSYWLSRRNEMGVRSPLPRKVSPDHTKYCHDTSSMSEESHSPDRTLSPPPLPRCTTEWVVRKATEQEINDFREQERRRYENPHMAFTYRQHGYDSVVGPVKGIYTQVPGLAKARGHNMLVDQRPNYVTILTLVRDAAARLPNGEGTRAEICELLKSSQYISPTATDQILQTIVSGALDRMHTEFDPCVRYDSKRKIWIYLHRNRSKEEFDKLHQQQQGVIKPRRLNSKKPKIKSPKSNRLGEETDLIQSKPLQTALPIHHTAQTSKPQITPSVEAIDVEASLDAHTTPILVKGRPTKPISTVKATVRKTIANAAIVNPRVIDSPQQSVAFKTVRPFAAMPTSIHQEGISSNRLILPVKPQSEPSMLKVASVPPTIIGQRIVRSANPPALTSSPQISRTVTSASLSAAAATTTTASTNTTNQPTKVYNQNFGASLKTTVGTSAVKTLMTTAASTKANIISSITVPKGHQSVLTASQQRQIFQTLITQQNKQKLSGSQKLPALTTIVSPAASSTPTPQMVHLRPAVSGDKVQPHSLPIVKSPIVTKATSANQPQIVINKQTLSAFKKQPMTIKVTNTPPLIHPGGSTKTIPSNSTPIATRLVRPAAPIATNTSKTNTSNPIMAKVLAADSSGQLVTLDSFLQKQGITTSSPALRMTKPGNTTNIIQLAGNSNSSVQYAVVTQPRTVVPVSSSRIITTQAATRSLAGAVKKTTDIKSQNSPVTEPMQINQGTASQFVNAKIVNVQNLNEAKLKTPGTIRMVNAANLNLTNLAGKPVIFASKQGGQNVTLQNSSSNDGGSNVLIGGQTIKVHGSLVQTSNSQSQTVVLSNQLLKLQPLTGVSKSISSSDSTVLTKSTTSIQQQTHTVKIQPQAAGSPSMTGTKVATVRATPNTNAQQRLVLATPNQPGLVTQQIILPSGFQSGALNIKTLQGIKVIPISQQGKVSSSDRPVFARIISSPQVKGTANQPGNTSGSK